MPKNLPVYRNREILCYTQNDILIYYIMQILLHSLNSIPLESSVIFVFLQLFCKFYCELSGIDDMFCDIIKILNCVIKKR